MQLFHKFLAALGFLVALAASQHAQAAVTCPLPYILQQGTIPNAVQVMADFYALQGCIQSGGGGGGGGTVVDCVTTPGACPFDVVQFWPGIPPASQVVRIALDRAITCPAGLGGSAGIAKTAATSSTVVNINQVTAGVGTLRGTATFAGSGTVATFAAASAINLAANDIVEFAYQGSPDASLADISITLKCQRTSGSAVAQAGSPLTSGHLFVGNSLNVATDVAASGDVTLLSTGAFTVAKVHGVAFPTSPSANQVPIATSGTNAIWGLLPNASLQNSSTTVNGQICILGASCTVTAAATGVTVGTTTIAGGTTGRVLYDNVGVLGEMTTTGSGTVLALATSPTIAGLTITGSLTATGLVTLADIATQAANTVIANVTAGTASPTAASLPSCVDSGGNHLNYTNGTGFSCGTTGGASGSIVVGTTTIGSGTSGRVLYDAAGVLGEMTTSGSGTVLALAASPSISALTVTSSFTATGLVTAADLFGTTGSGGNVVLATAPTVSALTVTGSLTATGLVTNADLVNAATTVNGQTCTLGSSCTITASAGTITVGTTVVASGTSGRLLFDNAGVLGEPVMSASSGALTVGTTTGPTAGSVTMAGSTSGSLQIKPAAAAGSGSVLTLPGGTTDFSATGGTNQLVKQVTAGGALTVGTVACAGLSNSGTACTAATGTSGTTLPFLDGTNTFSGIQTFGEVHGTTETVSLSSNNYNAVVADCGKTKLLPTGTTPTVTLPNINPASGSCTITFVTTAAKAYLFNAASGGSKQNSQGFYTTRGTAAGDTVSVILITPSVSAAAWNVAGDVTS